MKPLSKTQQETIKILQEHGGKIVRLAGGFWTYPDCSGKTSNNGFGEQYFAPDWNVDIRTVRCLERALLLVRANVFPEEWRDTRELAVFCDGCNVRDGHEHRCHNIGFPGYIMVRGEREYHKCDCQDCRVLWDDEYWQQVKNK